MNRQPQTSLHARVSLSRFARNLQSAWKELDLPKAGAVAIVAVSGGADSTALLVALDELVRLGKLKIKLVVAHLDHSLRRDSAKDAAWVKALARNLGHEVVIGKVQLKTKSNLEEVARTRRYDFLLRTANKHGAGIVVTAHTLDDQAETVLLRLIRGSAAEGLSGTLAIRPIKAGSKVKLARPLLSWARRNDTEEYCRSNGIEYRVDEMNSDPSFARVRVRNELMPVLQSFNRRIVETLGRTASLLSEDAETLAAHATQLFQAAVEYEDETKEPFINVKVLLSAPSAVRRRALRLWLSELRGDLRRIEMNHLIAVEGLLNGRGGSVIELPGRLNIMRNGQFLGASSEKSGEATPGNRKALKKRRRASKISGR